MKNNKFAKISLIILTVALCLGAMFAMSVSADGTEPAKRPVIDSQNLMYSDKYSLMYAVPADTVTGGSEGSVTLYLHEGEKPTEAIYETGIPYNGEFAAANTVGLKYDAFIFITDGIGAKAFATQYYSVVKDNNAAEDSENKFSVVYRYSVAEYLYESLAIPGRTESQKLMYQGAIDFATGVQMNIDLDGEEGTEDRVLDPENPADADKLIKNLRYVKVTGGTIDGFKTGVYPLDTALNLVPDEGASAKWSVVNYTDGVAAEPLINQTVVTVGDYEKIAVTFGEVLIIHYSDGYANFEDLTVGSSSVPYHHAAEYVLKQGTGTTREIVDVGGAYGTALYLGGTNNTTNRHQFYTYHITGKNFDKTNTPSTTTALEFSFDIKLDLSGDVSDKLTMRYYAIWGTYDVTLQQYDSKGNVLNKLLVNGHEFDVNPSEWFNVKIMSYADDDTGIYVYINDDVENAVHLTTPAFGDQSNNAFTPTGNSGVCNASGMGEADGYYIDNLFLGYTSATKANPFGAQATD